MTTAPEVSLGLQIPHPDINPQAFAWRIGSICVKQGSCLGVAFTPDFDVPSSLVKRSEDHAWLTAQLPSLHWRGADFRTWLSPDPDKPGSSYECFVQMLVEDARPEFAGHMVYVLYNWFSAAALRHDYNQLVTEARDAAILLDTHEVWEEFRADGAAIEVHGAE